MGGDQSSLLEAMEQQSISIAKAGIVCSLPARTSVLAAANPIGGHYDKTKTVGQNLKMMNSPLLSRFDLIFILLDKPNEEKDDLLAEHVMHIHSQKSTTSQSRTSFSQFSSTQSSNKTPQEHDLEIRLQPPTDKSGKAVHPIPAKLLRKYIAYAKKYVSPRLTEPACQVLQEFYLELRKKHREGNTTPITMRQLEFLVRLAEARAKMELREEVTEQDAKDVVSIMRSSMADVNGDNVVCLDMRAEKGRGGGKASLVFVRKLDALAKRTGSSLFKIERMKECYKEWHIRYDGGFGRFIEYLNDSGYLLKKPDEGRGVYELAFDS